MPRRDRCRSCNAPVFWTRTTAGKRMPVDADATEAGTHEIVIQSAGPTSRYVDPPMRPGRTDLHTSHFATCPQSEEWRNRR